MTDTKYHVIYPHNTEEDCMSEMNQLGTLSYPKKYVRGKLFHRKNVFTRNSGFYILEELINKKSRVLPYIRIMSSKGKEYTVEKFLDILSNLDMLI